MNQTMLFWLLLAGAAAITFSLRFSFIAYLEKIKEPPWFRRALKHVPPAVMAALVTSSLLIRDDQLAISWENHRLLAAIVAGAVGWWTKSLLWTILSGLAALFVIQRLLG